MNEYLEFIKLNMLLGTAEIISATIIGFLHENFIIILIYDHFIFSYLLQCVYPFKNDGQTNRVANKVSFLIIQTHSHWKDRQPLYNIRLQKQFLQTCVWTVLL